MAEIDVGLNILDHQLLDSDGRRCGNVDDLAIEGGAGEEAQVVAILSGPGVWRNRAGVLGRFAARACGRSAPAGSVASLRVSAATAACASRGARSGT